jgi:hypothetical protein
MKSIMKFMNATSKYVLFFGFFVIVSLFLQCLIPFFAKLTEITGYTGFFTVFLNQNFVLPMTIISDFWAAISAAYVGVDRGMYMIDGYKNGGNHSEAFSDDQLKHLTQVILQSFIIYSLAVGLNIFFDSDLALAPLAVSFGTSILLYVAGNKAVKGSQALSTTKNDVDNDGIDDSEQDQKEVLGRYKGMLKQREEILTKFEQMQKMGMKPEQILEKYREFCRKKGIADSLLKDLDEDGISDVSSKPSETLERLKLLIAQGKAIGIRTEMSL